MMITGKAIAIGAAVCVAGFGVGWRALHPRIPAATNAAIVDDVSDSMLDERSSIVGLASAFLDKPGLEKGSTLTVLTTGDNKSAGEPRLLAAYEVPFSRRFSEGKGAIVKRKREILADLDSRLQHVRQTDQSPIHLAAKRGIEQLHADGCGAGSSCILYIRTDAEELSEPSIKRALESGKTDGLPQPLVNEGIQTVFCGLAETNVAGRGDASRTRSLRNAAHGDRLRQVWLSLFTVPALVRFEPYCPKADQNPFGSKPGK